MPESMLRPRTLARALVLGVVAIFALRFTHFLFLDLADGRPGHVPERLFNEATGSLLAAIPLAATFWLARRWPLARPLRRGTVAVYLTSFVALSAVHTTAIVAARAALGPALGLSGYDWSFTAARYAYEAATDAVFFVATLSLLALAESVLAQRERERRATALERSLLRAELSNLRLQLQPHFLFNALNTISSTMYDDVDAADALLRRLSDLLRASLRTTHAQEVPARDELEALDQYLALMRARFGDRLDVVVDAPRDVHELLVPSMILQPLVENAVRHGALSRAGRGEVRVSLRREGEALSIVVRDSGLGTRDSGSPFPSPEPRVPSPDTGTGLTTTARRLRLLYGDAHSMRAGPAAGGWEVAIRIPARAAVPNATSGRGAALAEVG
jgi:two-component system, LytTR family, sensor kinase